MSWFKDFCAPALILGAICLVVTFALAYTNDVTAPVIEQGKIDQANAARAELIPGAAGFDPVTDAQFPAGVTDAYRETSGLGYVFTTVTKGYGGNYEAMVAISQEGKIIGLTVTDASNETPGLGSKTTNPDYLATYNGQDSSLSGVTKITGATISSTALKTNVQAAFAAYSVVTGVSTEVIDDFRTNLFPEGKKFEKIVFGNALEAYQVDDTGFILVAMSTGYYQTPMIAAVGFDNEGTIVGVDVTYLDESEGIGTQVADRAYLDQFVGKKDTEGVESIAGATVSSDALKRIVQAACDEFASVKGAK